MEMEQLSIGQLRRMNHQEGLVLQGCGGPVEEWVDGINELLTEEGILLEGTRFSRVGVFQNEGLTCLLFPFKEEQKLDMGRFAVWRLRTREPFGSMWLSDFVENYLGGFLSGAEEKIKPDCPLIGADGNIFNLMGIASRTLRENGMSDQISEMRNRITESGSYAQALVILGEYVNITGPDEEEEGEEWREEEEWTESAGAEMDW